VITSVSGPTPLQPRGSRRALRIFILSQYADVSVLRARGWSGRAQVLLPKLAADPKGIVICYFEYRRVQADFVLRFAHYNLVRIHKTLHVTPATAANVRIGF
jgi:uncharacterized membrane protein